MHRTMQLFSMHGMPLQLKHFVLEFSWCGRMYVCISLFFLWGQLFNCELHRIFYSFFSFSFLGKEHFWNKQKMVFDVWFFLISFFFVHSIWFGSLANGNKNWYIFHSENWKMIVLHGVCYESIILWSEQKKMPTKLMS